MKNFFQDLPDGSAFFGEHPGEVSDPIPNCSNCGDSGPYNNFVGEHDFCDCPSGEVAHHDWCGEQGDFDADHTRADEADYQAGVARGKLHSAERKIYGSQLADEFAMMDELNDYNNGY